MTKSTKNAQSTPVAEASTQQPASQTEEVSVESEPVSSDVKPQWPRDGQRLTYEALKAKLTIHLTIVRAGTHRCPED